MKNTIIKVLSVLMAMVFAFGSCVIAVAAEDAEVAAPACEHANAEVYGQVGKTCTTWGYTLYHCDDCGEYFTKDNPDEMIPPCNLTAGYKENTKRVYANCVEGQHKLLTCSICGTTRKEYLSEKDPNKHAWTDWAPTTANSCTEDGEEARTCELCGLTETRELLATDHKWVADEKNVIAPTCQTEGMMPYYCANEGCDATKEVVILPCDHMYVAMDAIVPECGEEGRTAGRYCTWCEIADPDDADAGYYTEADHDFQMVEDTYVAADCENAGSYKVKCEACGAEDTVVLPALGHEWERNPDMPYTDYKPETCTTMGYKVYACTDCEKGEIVFIDALGHDYQKVQAKDEVTGEPLFDADGNPIYVKNDPTCTLDGGYMLACSRCGHVDTEQNEETIPALGHTPVDVPATPATCTTTGLTAGVQCSVCGEWITAQTEIPANGHKYVNYICTVAGKMDSYCSVCGEFVKDGEIVEVSPDAAVSHVWGDFVEDRAATCTTPGAETKSCKYCDATFTRKIEALGHIEVRNDDLATCISAGSYNVTCDRCDEILAEGIYDIDETAHAGIVIEREEPTCTEDGFEKGTCTLCHEDYEIVLKATGHNETAVPGTEPGCTSTGLTAGIQCSVCQAWILPQEEIKANGHDLITYPAKGATCTEDGYTGGEECKNCDYAALGDIIPAFNHIDPVSGNSAYTSESVAASCANGGRIGYTYHCCTLCGDEYIDGYVYAPEHIWGDEIVVPVKCFEDGYTHKQCTVCGEFGEKYDIVEAKGHVNAAGEVVTTSCMRTTEDNFCVLCGQDIPTAHVIDNPVEELANCLTLHKLIGVCGVCGKEAVTVLDPNYGDHDYEVIYTNSDAIISNIAKIEKCTVCGDVKETPLADSTKLEFIAEASNSSTVDAENPVKFVNGVKASRTNYNKLIVNIYFRGAEGVTFNSAKFNFTFDTQALTLSKVIAADYMEKGEFSYNSATAGTIKMLYAHSNVLNEDGDQVLGELTASPEKKLFVTLEFTINDTFYGNSTKTTNVGSINNILVADAEKNEVTARANDCESQTIYKRGDLTGDGIINNVDLTCMLAYLATNGYEVQADLDLDGSVNARDYALMRDWIIDNIIYPANTK